MTENIEDEDIVIVSIRCKHPGHIAWNSTKYPCSKCGEQVWLAPSAQCELHKAKMVICAECFVKEYHGDEEVEIIPMSDKTRAELKREFGFTPLVRNQDIAKWLREKFKEE